MSRSIAQYFLSFPNQSSISSGNDNKEDNQINDKNPLKRKREIKLRSSHSSNESLIQEFPYPSSCYYNVFFQNTVSHPYLIFLNLEMKYERAGKGNAYPKNTSTIRGKKSIISLLNTYFGVKDILSYSSTKIDFIEVSETWNKRFPCAKSSSFSPILDDFTVSDLQDIQSLHLLGFTLNASFYLVFAIDIDEKGKSKKYFNMKLGPENSEHDVHFMVYENVDRTGTNYTTYDKKIITIYKHEKWFSFDLFDFGQFYEKKESFDLNDTLLKENGGVKFLEIEKRAPIPIIQLPNLDKIDFNAVSYKEYELDSQSTDHSNISFIVKSKKKSKTSKEVIIGVFHSKARRLEMLSINKIKSIATQFYNGKKQNIEVKRSEQNDTVFFAKMNKSAYLVAEEEADIPKITINRKISEKNFALTNQESIENIKNCIISFRERLKNPLTYNDIIKSKHPLIDYLCYYNVLNMMIKSADYIDEKLNREEKEESPILKVVPLVNNDIFFTYQKFSDCTPTKEINKIKEDWKNLSDTYPQLMSPSATRYNDISRDLLKQFESNDSPLFGYFYIYLIENIHSYAYNNTLQYLPIAERAIKEITESTFGLNPIIAPVIQKEFTQLSKICCIYFFSNQDYNKPVNDVLTRDIQSIREFNARTTVKFFNNESVLDRNAKVGAFPIKKQTFVNMLEMKKNKQIPDPSFAFRDQTELLGIINRSEDIDQINHVPTKQYKFSEILGNSLSSTYNFTILSQYEIKYFYVSRGNVFSVARIDDNKIAYGICKTMDTEIKFHKPISGRFVDAIFLEDDSCLIICYYNIKYNRYTFIGYDRQGKINEPILNEFDKDIKSLVVISRTFFASYDGGNDEKGLCVFKYDPKERKIEYSKYVEQWRILKNSLCKEYLKIKFKCNDNLKKEALGRNHIKEDIYVRDCFIGSQFSFGIKDTSTYCIYNLNNKKTIEVGFQPQNSFQPKLNFHLESDISNELNYSDDKNMDESELLNKRIENPKISIPSMLNYLPIESRKKTFSTFDLHCSLCELFPVPIAINGHIVRCANDQLSLYLCDYQIYRFLSHQIYGFYSNTLEKISLFATEVLLNSYSFKEVHIAVIIDTCGIGAKLSNLIFGTRFNEKEIYSEDIWSGFSYSKNLATIILLFRVSDINSIYNATKILQAEKKKRIFSFFVCQKEEIKYSIKYGFNPDIISNGLNCNSTYITEEISFISNLDFQNQARILKVSLDENQDPEEEDYSYDSGMALTLSKIFLTRYFTFHAFENYPLETIEKYSKKPEKK